MSFLVYVVALVITAGSIALGIDFLTTPDFKPRADKVALSSSAVKQVPIGNASSASVASGAVPNGPSTGATKPEHIGDPNNVLTPVYPAAPGKNLPVADVPVVEPVAPVTAPTTTGSATPGTAVAPQPAVAAVQTPQAAPPNSCAVDACADAYRSFRASDCSYQPFGGGRKTCDLPSNGASSVASNVPAVSTPPISREVSRDMPREVSRARAQSRGNELDEVVRAVRRLPAPPSMMEYDDRGRVIVIERPDRTRYEVRRNWVYEE